MNAKKTINIKKIQYINEVLSLIRETIDPDAFIAGGCAVEMHLASDLVYSSDIDIYFKNTMFDIDPCGLDSYNTLKSVLEANKYSAYKKNLEIYYYHHKIRRIATSFKGGFNFDFIQYSSKMNRKEVLNSFDLDECKITLIPCFGNLITNPSDEFLEAWKTVEINPHYDMFGYDPVNKIQNEKTKKRVEKWLKRKKQYFKK
jgi:hypothetical protein